MTPRVVTQAHTKSYADPLVVRVHDIVSLGDRDDEWPGWIWCVDKAARGGWLPEDIVELTGEAGRIREAFDTTELTVDVAEAVHGGRIVAGWQWCRHADGREGWVPVRCLRGQRKVS